MQLLHQKHARFFGLCLNLLPQKAESEDANKMSIIYFVLNGLDLLGQLPLAGDPQEIISHIYSHLIPLQNDSMQAFRASETFELASVSNAYDLPNLSATFLALANLLVLEENYLRRLDRHKIMKFVRSCQVTEGPERGSFRPILSRDNTAWGDSDPRLCYIASCIRKLVGYDNLAESEREWDIDVAQMQSFVLKLSNYNGGFSSDTHTELHAGLTFCGIAALLLTGYEFLPTDGWVSRTLNWLVHRQVDYPASYDNDDYEYYVDEDIGGFNGRENKFADTCYAWWVCALLELLLPGKGVQLLNPDQALSYLLEHTQHSIVGGFGKNGDAFPDPFHTFLGLGSISLIHSAFPELAILGVEHLSAMDAQLVITQRLRKFLNLIVKKASSEF